MAKPAKVKFSVKLILDDAVIFCERAFEKTQNKRLKLSKRDREIICHLPSGLKDL